MERAFLGGDNRQNKCLSIYSFYQNESIHPAIVSFLSLCVRRSVGCTHGGGVCTVSRSDRKSKRGVKLTSSSGNSTVDGRFHLRDVRIIHKYVQAEDPGRDVKGHFS